MTRRVRRDEATGLPLEAKPKPRGDRLRGYRQTAALVGISMGRNALARWLDESEQTGNHRATPPPDPPLPA